eukprot:3029918-Amphidinium_carterae.1
MHGMQTKVDRIFQERKELLDFEERVNALEGAMQPVLLLAAGGACGCVSHHYALQCEEESRAPHANMTMMKCKSESSKSSVIGAPPCGRLVSLCAALERGKAMPPPHRVARCVASDRVFSDHTWDLCV